jgi:hypothetical protein
MQLSLFSQALNERDVVYTPIPIAKTIIEFLNPSGNLLDPCRGKGSFFDNFPEQTTNKYCEISEGIDFFNYDTQTDWIIGNPPYSIFNEFLEHGFEISKNISFLVPVNKVFQKEKVMQLINDFGGIKSILFFGTGFKINFNFGYPVANFHFEKHYSGETQLILGLEKINNITKKRGVSN